MKNRAIECQRGMENVKKYLEDKGYNCFLTGERKENADVLLVNIPDSSWEELNSTNCMTEGGKEKLVINVYDVDVEEIAKLIENSICRF